MALDFSIESKLSYNIVCQKLLLTHCFGGDMTKVIRVSKSLITFFLFSILSLATMAHAQPINPNCKDLANKMMRGDIQINKIQRQMANAIGNVYQPSIYDQQVQKSKKQPKLMDRHNRHVNILIHNLGRRVTSMKGLLEYAKQQENNCRELVRKISDKINAIQDIHAEMERSLGNVNTSESEFQVLIKNLNQQTGGNNS